VFVDQTAIVVQAGKGGDGCVAFLREKYRPYGGPAGGDGGRGGSVILEATHRVQTLLEIARRVHFRADKGQPGGPRNRTGRSASDLTIEVPRGTVVRVAPESPGSLDLPGAPKPPLLCDMTEEGQRFCAARGGKGGRGNARFASSVNQVPREFEPGELGEDRRILLELKLLADVGLVGLPSAGKSTLISRVSAARPKIAAYPFTTLSPVPGIVDLGGFRTCVFADLPGLIAGAHEGVGLGIRFLRHVERTRLLLHLIDGAPLDERDPVEAYEEIRNELRSYDEALVRKPELVVVSKTDLPGAEAARDRLRAALPGREVLAISSVTGAGLPALLGAVGRHLEALDRAEAEAAAKAAARAAEAGARSPEADAL